jgi:hypothetical protein
LAGKSLIRASELRSIGTQYQKMYGAVIAFKEKYFALPGDMTNATQFWGVAAAGLMCVSTPSVDAKTCDGNGNGKIDYIFGVSYSKEYYRIWQHLANAQLIEGSFNGDSDVLKARMKPIAWRIDHYDEATVLMNQIVSNSMFSGEYRNTFYLSTPVANSLLTPIDTMNLDMKLDDGKPATGKIVSWSGSTVANCTDAASYTTLTADYLFTQTAPICSLMFRNQF